MLPVITSRITLPTPAVIISLLVLRAIVITIVSLVLLVLVGVLWLLSAGDWLITEVKRVSLVRVLVCLLLLVVVVFLYPLYRQYKQVKTADFLLHVVEYRG
jgi:hypothetical protein